MEFLVIKDGAEYGTFTIPEISLFLQAGRLAISDSVRLEGRDVPISSIPELRDLTAQAAQPPGSQPAAATAASKPKHKIDPTRLVVYESLKDVVRAEVEEFTAPYQYEPDHLTGLQSLRNPIFFLKFSTAANAFTDNCCQKLTRIIRTASIIPAVREAPTPELAKRLRDTGFRRLDQLLSRYFSLAKRVDVLDANIRTIRAELYPAEASNSEGSSSGPQEPLKSQPEWATPERLEKETGLLLQAKHAALLKIREFFQGIETLPEALLSYACDKCFAAEAEFEFERTLAAELKAILQPKLANAVGILDRAVALEKADLDNHQQMMMRAQEQRYASEALGKVAESKRERKAMSQQRYKSVVGTVVILILISSAVMVAALWQKLFGG